MKKQEIKLIEDCIIKWGKNTQIDILIEEMSELTKALLKQRRMFKPHWYSWFTVMEEFVDVSISLKIIEIILKQNHITDEMIESKTKEKLKYLRNIYERCSNKEKQEMV